MGNIQEELVRRNEIVQSETMKKYKKTKRFIESKGVYNILKRTASHLLPNGKKIDKFTLNMNGGSYTDGENVTVAACRYTWGMEDQHVYAVLKALTGHEVEHIVSSDFDIFLDFQVQMGNDFTNFTQNGVLGNYNTNYLTKEKAQLELQKMRNSYGIKLAAHLLNSIEDGRIEKRLGNRMRGYVKHIKFMNSLIWDNQPVKGENKLQEFLFCITSLSVTGLKTKDWSLIYDGTELDKLINDVRPLIIKGINEPSPLGCAIRTWEVYQVIAPKIAEMVQEQQEAMDEMSDELNFSDTTPAEGEDSPGSDGAGNAISTHFVPENNETKEESDSESESSKGKNANEDQEDLEKDSNEGNSDETEEDLENESNNSGSDDETDGSNSDEENYDEDNSNETQEKSKINSDEVAKREEEMVKDFLRNTTEELMEELTNDFEKIKKEELKIVNTEKDCDKNSDDLSKAELETQFKGTKISNFRLHKMSVNKGVETPQEVVLKAKKIRKELERILLDKQGYTSKNRKKGQLNSNDIWKLGIKDYNTFVKKGKPDNSTYVANILVDNSGSMSDPCNSGFRKSYHANLACAILEESLKGLIPFRITKFDAYNGVMNHYVVSDFKDEGKENRTLGTTTRPDNMNCDSMSIRVATQELLKRPENKKILFVLSDGLPSVGSEYGCSPEKSVQKAVRDARKAGVTVIAICFGSEQHLNSTREKYHEMYQKGIIMVSPENISSHLAKAIEREIKR